MLRAGRVARGLGAPRNPPVAATEAPWCCTIITCRWPRRPPFAQHTATAAYTATMRPPAGAAAARAFDCAPAGRGGAQGGGFVVILD